MTDEAITDPHTLSADDGRSAGTKTSTPQSIIDAALTILGQEGFQRLTTRAIADLAGVNQALINYHFGTKDKLLLKISDTLESGNYVRQSNMYHEPDVPLSRKWRQAVEYYRIDIAEGYVRVSQELYALGYSDSRIAAHMTTRLMRWQSLLEEVAAAYLPSLGIHVPPAYVASAIASFWIGMSTRILAGEAESTERFFEILDYVGDMLEELERKSARSATSGDLSPDTVGIE